MKLINIGIAGCLGRMGQELVKEVVNNKNINFTGGFEHPQHEGLHKKISDFIDVETDYIVSNDPNKIFSDSDVPKSFLRQSKSNSSPLESIIFLISLHFMESAFPFES